MAENDLSVEMEADNKKSCNTCSSGSNLKRCNRCKSVFYCSRDHQKQDWTKHKKVCTPPQIQESDDCTTTTRSRSSTNTNSINGVSDNDRKLTQIQIQNEQQAEIHSILNFESVGNEVTSDNTSQCKDIFSDLVNSKQDDYMGPSDDAIITGVEEMLLNAEEEQADREENSELPQEKPLEIVDETDFIKHKHHGGKDHVDEDDDFIAFDNRPLRKLKFPLPESYKHKDLGEFIALRLINLGYGVVDNVFPKEYIDGLISEIKSLNANNELKTGQLGGGKTSGEDDKKSTRTDIRSDKIKWIHGDEEGLFYAGRAIMIMDSIMQFVSQYLRVKKYGNIQGRSKAMLTCYPGNGTFYRRHIDNPNKDGRRITCILYLNKDWDVEKDGGLLRILPPSQEKQVDIPPKANRLLYFWSDKRNPHEVHPAYRERFAMTVWYFDSDERTASKVQRLQAETDSINQKITELEDKRKQMEEATRQQQIQNKAMEAVKSLSEEEIQALATLVHTHPRPRQMLTAMGISSHIQDALIQHLTNL